MNLRLSEEFGQYFVRLPLKKSPTIVCGNALRLGWNKILPPDQCSFVLGNPPFVGKKARNAEQQADMEIVFGSVKGVGVLDYVCCWYLRAGQYIRGTQIKVGFVSTNSVMQGEQPGVLWPILFRTLGLKILFAHRTFTWESEARGRAHVHVVIIGFGAFDSQNKRIYDYESDGKTVLVIPASNISPYLIEGRDRALQNREHPVCGVPEMQFGNMPNDDGNLILSDEEKKRLLRDVPQARPLVRPLLSAQEYLHGENRWCLWLKDVEPQTIRKLEEVHRRVEAVSAYRSMSKREATKKLANYPTLFAEIRQPTTKFVLVPRHSSETRRYIPLSYFPPYYVPSDSCLFLENVSLYHFGVLSSGIHMAWVKQVCGRLESRYRYSNKLVYNNYPWPEAPTAKQRAAIEAAAQAVLDARKAFPNATLADLYDPLAMPPALVKAHAELDRAVDLCYRPQPFQNDRQRVEHLFALYERLTAPLIAPAKKTRRKKVAM
ncbi:MAG: hypothetical protein NVS9B13_25640 [Candidatus Acidiferrum sp.]